VNGLIAISIIQNNTGKYFDVKLEEIILYLAEVNGTEFVNALYQTV
jgi:hypothetical protein